MERSSVHLMGWTAHAVTSSPCGQAPAASSGSRSKCGSPAPLGGCRQRTAFCCAGSGWTRRWRTLPASAGGRRAQWGIPWHLHPCQAWLACNIHLPSTTRPLASWPTLGKRATTLRYCRRERAGDTGYQTETAGQAANPCTPVGFLQTCTHAHLSLQDARVALDAWQRCHHHCPGARHSVLHPVELQGREDSR